MKKIYYQRHKTPIPQTDIIIAANDKHLFSIVADANWLIIKKNFVHLVDESNAVIEQTKLQLDEYFSGVRQDFDLPVAFAYGTAFQQSAWSALLQIPYGETRSYSDQAQFINNPKAVRAIGRSNGLNPISIVVPCHRVIGKSGQLTGYAGGLDMKRYLLELEGVFNTSSKT